MTYEVGQKILVEATVRNPEIDEDGDIRVVVGGYEYIYAPAAATRPIDPEPQTIAFDDIQVGDVIRATFTNRSRMNGYTSTEICVREPLIVTGKGVDDLSCTGFFLVNASRYTFELISRPEPEPIKVGDTVTVEQVKMLPVGSVVTKDDSWFDIKDRMVTGTGLYNPQDVKVTVWHVYNGDTFTVKYIAEAS